MRETSFSRTKPECWPGLAAHNFNYFLRTTFYFLEALMGFLVTLDKKYFRRKYIVLYCYLWLATGGQVAEINVNLCVTQAYDAYCVSLFLFSMPNLSSDLFDLQPAFVPTVQGTAATATSAGSAWGGKLIWFDWVMTSVWWVIP